MNNINKNSSDKNVEKNKENKKNLDKIKDNINKNKKEKAYLKNRSSILNDQDLYKNIFNNTMTINYFFKYEINNEMKLLNNVLDGMFSVIKENNKIFSSIIEKSFQFYDIQKVILQDYIKNINFDELKISEDGIIKYEDEQIILNNETVSDCFKTLEDITKNPKELKNDNNKSSKPIKAKSIVLSIIVFIILNFFGGFFNKAGENSFDLISNAYKGYIKREKVDPGEKSKQNFMENYRIVNAKELNVREDSSSSSPLIGKLYLNECVEVLEKVNYWTKIRYENKEKEILIIGWVYSRYLSMFDESTSSFIVCEEKVK